MMFDVEINGRNRRVSVERSAPDQYRITVDGRAHEVDAARVGTLGLSLLLDGMRSRDVQVAPARATGEMLIRLEGRTARATLNGRRPRAGFDASARAHGEQKVVAPMPGRVVRVLVAAGDTVAARDAVVVVEAMKMENELRALKAGRVKTVAVEAGASVEAGRVLVVIE
jgi:biotin carboxyl carrier protein